MKKRRLKKSVKIYRALLCGGFTIIVIGIFIANLSKSDDAISILENRNLKQKPEITSENIFSGKFTKEFEDYLCDQFIGRELWIKSKAQIDISLGKNKINDVYLGKEDYLMEQFKKTGDEELLSKTKAINDFVNKNSKINTSMMLVPTATKVLENKLPDNAYVDDELNYIESVKNNLDEKIKFIGLYDELKSHENEGLYYKTDHHWTTKGAYIAYKKMCEDLKMDYKKENEFEVKTATKDFYGSLYYKLGAGIGNPDEINIYVPKKEEKIVVDYVEENKKVASVYNSESLDAKDKYEVFMGGNHSVVDIKTLVDNDKKLLVIKDSYANSIIPFLTHNYNEIVVVDLRYYNDNIQDIISTYGITDMLFLYNVNTFNTDKSILNLEE